MHKQRKYHNSNIRKVEQRIKNLFPQNKICLSLRDTNNWNIILKVRKQNTILKIHKSTWCLSWFFSIKNGIFLNKRINIVRSSRISRSTRKENKEERSLEESYSTSYPRATIPIKLVIFPIRFVRAIDTMIKKKRERKNNTSSPHARYILRESRIFLWYSADRVISFRGAYWGGRSDSTLKFLNRRTGIVFARGNNRVELQYSNPNIVEKSKSDL